MRKFPDAEELPTSVETTVWATTSKSQSSRAFSYAYTDTDSDRYTVGDRSPIPSQHRPQLPRRRAIHRALTNSNRNSLANADRSSPLAGAIYSAFPDGNGNPLAATERVARPGVLRNCLACHRDGAI